MPILVLSVPLEVADQWGGGRKKIRIRLKLPKRPWTGVQAQKELADASLPYLSRCCSEQGIGPAQMVKGHLSFR